MSPIRAGYTFSGDKITQIVTPAKFLKIVKSHRSSIKNTKFIPPKVGENNFGRFEIEYAR